MINTPQPPQGGLTTTALFIGRFQPFHKGHLSVVQEICSQHEKIIIGIGSAEDNYLPKNPFTAGERYEMIRATLENENFDLAKIIIIPVRNINNYALWVRHVELILPKFDVVYTGSAIVRKLFEKDGKYKINQVQKKIQVNATTVRQKMFEEKDWEKLVSLPVSDYLKMIKGVERIQSLT